MHLGLKLAAFGLTALAVVATSPAPPPRTTFNVDLVTRNRTVLEVRTIDSETVGLSMSYQVDHLEDGGVPPTLVVASSDVKPTARGVELALQSTLLVGELEELGTISVGTEISAARVFPRSNFGGDFLSVSSTPVYLSFIRRGGGPLVVQSISSPSCGNTCPQIIFDDITEQLE
ncbi:MAG: hypothetical protein JNG84_00440 [Archangium sp.]|nr:hypothetical protein [Archangium sp.]